MKNKKSFYTKKFENIVPGIFLDRSQVEKIFKIGGPCKYVE